MNIIMILLAFNFILIIHELGHFIVAKISKIKVEEFHSLLALNCLVLLKVRQLIH